MAELGVLRLLWQPTTPTLQVSITCYYIKFRPNFTPLSFGIFFLKMHRILNTWDSGGIGHNNNLRWWTLLDPKMFQINMTNFCIFSKQCDADVFRTHVTITTDAIIWPNYKTKLQNWKMVQLHLFSVSHFCSRENFIFATHSRVENFLDQQLPKVWNSKTLKMHNAHPHALNNNHPEATFALGIEANLSERCENKICPGTLKERNLLKQKRKIVKFWRSFFFFCI